MGAISKVAEAGLLDSKFLEEIIDISCSGERNFNLTGELDVLSTSEESSVVQQEVYYSPLSRTS